MNDIIFSYRLYRIFAGLERKTARSVVFATEVPWSSKSYRSQACHRQIISKRSRTCETFCAAAFARLLNIGVRGCARIEVHGHTYGRLKPSVPNQYFPCLFLRRMRYVFAVEGWLYTFSGRLLRQFCFRVLIDQQVPASWCWGLASIRERTVHESQVSPKDRKVRERQYLKSIRKKTCRMNSVPSVWLHHLLLEEIKIERFLVVSSGHGNYQIIHRYRLVGRLVFRVCDELYLDKIFDN